MLRFEGITKSFGWRPVFQGLGHRLGAGVHALQGPNGIGKSTLLAILAGALEADAGEVWVDGVSMRDNPRVARMRLSYAPDESPIYPFMTGIDLLDFVAMAKKVRVGQGILERVDRFGLRPYLHTRFSAMSLGTQKKFMLTAAWIGEPKAMFLDEPSNGLDAQARACLVELLRKHGQQNLILLSTHDMGFVSSCGATVLTMESMETRGDAMA